MSKRIGAVGAITLILAVLLAGAAAAWDCIDYRDYASCLGSLEMVQGRDLAVSGNYVYVADGFGLQVVDISVPESPEIVGQLAMPYFTTAVAVEGHHAYVADWSGLKVIDVGEPNDPQIVGSVDIPGGIWDVVISGNHAYIAANESGFMVVDVSDPFDPRIVGSVDTPGVAWDVAISGGFAYVADRGSGLQVIDVSEPEAAELVACLDIPGEVRGVAVSGSYAYVAVDASGLMVIGIGNPSSPLVISTVGTEGPAVGVALSGDHAFVVTNGMVKGLAMIDISNPWHPVLLDERGISDWGDDASVVVSEDRVLVLGACYYQFCFSLLYIFDIGGPLLLPTVGSVDTPGTAIDLEIVGDFVYVADGESGLQVVDISQTENPQIIGEVDTPGEAREVVVSGEYAYVADGEPGLQVVDIVDPTSPTIVGSLETLDTCNGVAVSGDFAYVLSWHGLNVVDITDPQNPEFVVFVELASGDFGVVFNIELSGDHAYVVGAGGLHIINISIPQNPQIVGGTGAPVIAFGLALEGDFAFLTWGTLFSHECGFQIVDISDEANPQITGAVELIGIGDMIIGGGFAYVAGPRVIDISDPTDPVTIAECMAAPGGTIGAIRGDQLFMAAGRDGLQILPVQCPTVVSIENDPDSDGDIVEVEPGFVVHPNPFNPQTTVSFTLPRAGWADVSVYDLTGRQVTSLASRLFDAGQHTVNWNGSDSRGRAVPSGTYIVRLETDERVESRKVMLVR
jgi:hypothetical protein